MLSRVVRQGSMVGFWNAMPASFTGAPTCLPSTITVPFAGKLQAGGELHQGGLAAARGADDGGELALVHLEVQVLDGRQRRPRPAHRHG